MHTVAVAMGPMAKGPKPDNGLLCQYEQQIAGFKSELTDLSRSVISMKGGDKTCQAGKLRWTERSSRFVLR